MQNEEKIIEKNICDVCGSEVNVVNNISGCPICEDIYFDKIKESYSQNLQRSNILSGNLFRFYFDLHEELTKSSYEIMNQYLEMEKNLRIYNPSWYYFLTSYQFLRNRFLGNTMQVVSMLYSNCTDVLKGNLSSMSKIIVATLENMNKFCNTCNETMNIKEESNLSEGDKNLIKTINDINKMHVSNPKERPKIKTDDSENIRVLTKK